MQKINWYQYLALPQSRKDLFCGVVLNKDNIALCFEKKEERKYKNALAKKLKGEL